MKTTKNIARLAVTAGLTAALTFGGVMAPVTMAFAAEGSTVTFEDTDYATTTTYKGIQIFKAKVTTSNGATTLSNIEWGSDIIKNAVKAAIQTKDETYDSENAQDAADWLNEYAKVTETDSKVASDNVLSRIAANLDNKGGWVTSNNACLSGLGAGYWLFLTASASKPDGKSTDTFTSPVYAAIDGTSTTTVKPKKNIPTVEKKILDDADATVADIKTSDKWRDVADSQIGQEVNYKLTGTIASNYATFGTYAYKFTDQLSTGLDYVDNSVEVYALNGNTYTKISSSSYTVSFQAKNLTVDFAVDNNGKKGLKSANADGAGALSIDSNTKIVVFYKAKLNKDAIIGNNTAENTVGGNPNTVKLEYSNNPYVVEGRGETIENTVADFAFKLNLNKVDQGTEKGLGGAVFTIQSADTNTKDQYIASTEGTVDGASVVAGQLVTVANANNLPECVKFTSGADGNIAVSGLDAGSYTVTEIKTPSDKYTEAKPFTITITSTYDDNTMKVSGLKAEVSEDDKNRTDIAFCKLDGVAGDNVLKKEDGAQFDVDKGEITVFVGNTKQINLPLTGLNGVTFTWIAGGAVLCIGVAHLIRSRKRDEGSEE